MIPYLKKCPECGSPSISYSREHGEINCKDCGLVIDDRLVQSDKQIEIDDDNNPKGAGSVISFRFSDQGLFTKIGDSSDLKGLPAEKKWAIKRLKTWQHRIRSAIEKNLDIALNFIKTYISNLKLPDNLEEEACRIYTLAVQKRITKGRPMEHTAAAAVYLAAREHNVPLSLESISRVTLSQKKEIGRAVRILCKELNIYLDPQKPEDYVSKICGNLSLGAVVQTKAITLLEKADKEINLSGKCPMSLAASAVYICALLEGQKRNQKEVSDASGVTEVTLRNRYVELTKLMHIEFYATRRKTVKFYEDGKGPD